jgi:hypothetical protein
MVRLTPKKTLLGNSKCRRGGKCRRQPTPRCRGGHRSPTVTDKMATPWVRSFHLAIQLMLPLIPQTLPAKTRRVLPLAVARLLLGLRIGLRRRCSGLRPRPRPPPEAAKCHRSGGGAAVASRACSGGGEAMEEDGRRWPPLVVEHHLVMAQEVFKPLSQARDPLTTTPIFALLMRTWQKN